MPRFKVNRWWTSILTITALLVVSAVFVPRSSADPIRESTWSWNDPSFSGGYTPPPTGVGDPDQPVNSSLKSVQRGSVYSGGVALTSRTAGDSRIAGNVWMWRLLVMRRLMWSLWFHV